MFFLIMSSGGTRKLVEGDNAMVRMTKGNFPKGKQSFSNEFEDKLSKWAGKAKPGNFLSLKPTSGGRIEVFALGETMTKDIIVNMEARSVIQVVGLPSTIPTYRLNSATDALESDDDPDEDPEEEDEDTEGI